MQISWRRIAASEINHELIWLSISLAALAGAVVWFALRLPWPRCMFLAITGHPCMTCGATRSAIAFLHGQFLTAWRWNPLVFVFLCGVVLYDFYAAAVLTLRAPRLRISHFTSPEKKWVRVLFIALLALNWIYLLSRPPGIF
jgi:hypothetical protein